MNLRGHLTTGVAGAGIWLAMTRDHGVADLPAPLPLLGAVLVVFGSLAPDLDSPTGWLSRKIPILHYLIKVAGSNPLWWFLARDDTGYGRRKEKHDWLWKAIDNMLTRHLFNNPGRLAFSVSQGRARTKKAMSHRAASHSLPGMFLGGAGMLMALFLLWKTMWIAARTITESGSHGAVTMRLAQAYLSARPSDVLLWLSTSFLIGYMIHLLADMTTVRGVPLLWPFRQRSFWIFPEAMRTSSGRHNQ